MNFARSRTGPARRSLSVANQMAGRENAPMFQPGQNVRLNLAGMQVGSVSFQAAVTAAAGTIVRQVSPDPPRYRVKLTFSFRGISELEVPEDRIQAA